MNQISAFHRTHDYSDTSFTIEFAVVFLVKPATFDDAMLRMIGRFAVKAMFMQNPKKRVHFWCASISRIISDPTIDMARLAAMK